MPVVRPKDSSSTFGAPVRPRVGSGKYERLRQAAKGQACVRCGVEDGTVVLAHYTGARRLSYQQRTKSHDLVGAHLCLLCHQHMDTGSRVKAARWEHSEQFQHYCLLTAIRLWEQGVIGLL